MSSEIRPMTIKRISKDIKLFLNDEHKNIFIYPNPDNILVIFFLLKGQEGTEYENGEYLCKLVHNNNYPLKAPDYYVFTPNGRFEINKKICLSNSAFHQAEWAPGAWNLLSLLNGFFSIWHSDIKEDRIGISHITKINKDKIKEYNENSKTYNTVTHSEIYDKFI
jgi:ubiquitin-protein ligase